MHQETLDVTEDNVTAEGAVAARPLVETDPLPADLRTILEGIAAGITVQDERGRLLFVNEEAARLAGFGSPLEMLDATPDELVDRFAMIDEEGRPFDRSRLPGRRAQGGEPVEPVLVGFRLVGGLADRW